VLTMIDVLIGKALRIGLFRFTLTPAQTLEVPAINKGNMLRGGFGHAFRRLCCIPQCKDGRTCPLADSCPYKAVFEPSPPPGADRLSKNQDIPRPFVFRPPLDVSTETAVILSEAKDLRSSLRASSVGNLATKTRYDPGERFEFDLVLIGRALDFLPYFVLSFRELAAKVPRRSNATGRVYAHSDWGVVGGAEASIAPDTLHCPGRWLS